MTIESILKQFCETDGQAIMVTSEADLNRAKMLLDLKVIDPTGYIRYENGQFILKDIPNDYDDKVYSVNFVPMSHIAREAAAYLTDGRATDMEILH